MQGAQPSPFGQVPNMQQQVPQQFQPQPQQGVPGFQPQQLPQQMPQQLPQQAPQQAPPGQNVVPQSAQDPGYLAGQQIAQLQQQIAQLQGTYSGNPGTGNAGKLDPSVMTDEQLMQLVMQNENVFNGYYNDAIAAGYGQGG